MNLYALFGLCFLPVLLLIVFFAFLNKSLKIRHYAISVALGVVTVIPTSFIQYFVYSIPFFASASFFSVLVASLLLNGFLEESVKLGLECLIPKKGAPFPTFFCCAALFGLAVGSFESIVYTLNKVRLAEIPVNQHEAVKFILQRMISAQLIHLFCAALVGSFLWTVLQKKRRISIFAIAVLLHGCYDFFMTLGRNFRWFAVAAILLSAIETRQFYKEIAHPHGESHES